MTPRVSFVYPALNEERNIRRCLDSVAKQTYPHDRIEIIIADGHSTDRTREIVEAWRQAHDIAVRIVDNDRVVAEFGNAVGLQAATGDYVWVQGCDQEILQEDALETYLKAFEIFPDIVGVRSQVLETPGGSVLNNYYAIAGSWNDPLAREMIPPLRRLDARQVDGKTYVKMAFPAAFPRQLLFRRDAIEDFLGAESFWEGTVMGELARRDRNKLAIVEGYGHYHHHTSTLGDFLRKRAKIAKKHTTRVKDEKSWMDYSSRSRYLWLFALLHLTVVYPVVYSLYRAVRDRKATWLVHGPLCFLGVTAYAVNVLYVKVTGKTAW